MQELNKHVKEINHLLERYGVRFGYQDMNQVMRILKDMDLRQKDQDFGVDCSLKAWVRLSAEADMLDRFSGIGSVVVEEIQ